MRDFQPKPVLATVAAGIILVFAACSSTGPPGEPGDVTAYSGSSHAEDRKLSPKAQIARLRVERDQLLQANRLLEAELRETHEDLKRIERQFAVYEERISSEQGKAAAVAASAEARIRVDRIVRERPTVLTDSTAKYVRELIDASDRFVKKQNYAAAQFFAERAHHTMSSAERRANVERSAVVRTVIVDVANVREGPGSGYPVVDRVPGGASLMCWGEAAEWYHVRTPKGAKGWIHASLVR